MTEVVRVAVCHVGGVEPSRIEHERIESAGMWVAITYGKTEKNRRINIGNQEKGK